MNMIERVGSALAASSPFTTLSWNLLTDKTKEQWKKDAKIAIEAMRMPTEEMKKQWNDEFADGRPYWQTFWQTFCEMNWNTGINAALKE